VWGDRCSVVGYFVWGVRIVVVGYCVCVCDMFCVIGFCVCRATRVLL